MYFGLHVKMPSPQPYTYQHLANGEDVKSLNSDSLHSTEYVTTEASQICSIRIFSLPGGFLLLNMILFCLSLLILMRSIMHTQDLSHNIDNILLRKTSSYSPILDKIPISLTEVRTHGSFFAEQPPSIFQMPPSPEVDEAWDRISDTHAITLTRQEVVSMGRDPAEQWRFPREYGYGDEAYMGLLDVSHHLHCLNALRQAAHPDYYFNHTGSHMGSKSRSAPGKVHFTRGGHDLHCQYILLQFILCHADVGVITFNKVEGVRGPMADFSIDHKCRDHDSIIQWKLDHQVNVTDEQWALINRVPEGIRELSGEGRSRPFH